MNTLDAFLTLVDAYREAANVGQSYVSGKIFSDWDRIDQIRSGDSDVGHRRLLKAIDWFDANWPAGAQWPVGVARSSLTREQAA